LNAYTSVRLNLNFKKRLFCVTAAFEETDELLSQLQKKMDSLQSDLYKDYQPEIRVSTLASSVNPLNPELNPVC
jgi:hypothetical protein